MNSAPIVPRTLIAARSSQFAEDRRSVRLEPLAHLGAKERLGEAC